MSKKTTRGKKSESHPSERHTSPHDQQNSNGHLSNTERKLLQERIAQLERIVAAQEAAASKDVVSPRAKSKSTKKPKRPTLQMALTVSATKRPSTSSSKGMKSSKSSQFLEDHFTTLNLDLDDDFDEEDYEELDYDSCDDESDQFDFASEEEEERLTVQDFGLDAMSVESGYDDASSIASSSTLNFAEGFGPREGELDSDIIGEFRDHLDRNQVLVLPTLLDKYPSLLNHHFGPLTALQLVIERRSIELLELLLSYPTMDMSETSSGGRNIAHWILLETSELEKFHADALELILARRPDFPFGDDDNEGCPALWYAITRASQLSQSVAININSYPDTAHFAQTQMDLYLACAESLAKRNPNLTGQRAQIPILSLTIKLVFVEGFNLLLACGANPNAQDAMGDTPLHYVINAMSDMNFAKVVVMGAGASNNHGGANASVGTANAGSLNNSLNAGITPSTSSSGLVSSTTSLGASASLPNMANMRTSGQHTPSKGRSTEISRPSSSIIDTPRASGDFSRVVSRELLPLTSSSTPVLAHSNASTPGFQSPPLASNPSTPFTSPGPNQRKLNRSASLDISEVPGVRMTSAVRHMCTSLLDLRANIYLANHQQVTPHAKSFLRPEIQVLFENYNPGCKAWKHRITKLQFGERIGSGAFGEVYLAKLHGSEFAVKMIELAEASKHEAGIMSDIRHPNILTFVGMYYPEQDIFPDGYAPNSSTDAFGTAFMGKVGIVTEYLPMGSLSQFLGFYKDASPAPTVIAWPVMMRIALTVARGMAWLHSREPAIYHHDLHAGNVLLSTEMGDTKLCDFGLSRVHGRVPTQHYDRIRAPENYLGPGSDVYCFGFLLYQLLYAEKANKERVSQLASKFTLSTVSSDSANALAAVDPKIKARRPWVKSPNGFQLVNADPWPAGSNIRYFDVAHLIVQCTLTDPKQRPSFETIVANLEDLSTPKTLFRASPAFVPLSSAQSGYTDPQ